ncbi:MAG: DUF512 domain-containing protein [Bacillota bacterium]|nr:DUF512 domain-containing protein [Bacillota bacterium]
MRRISKVLKGSPAERHKIESGQVLVSINGEPVLDEIDYQALSANRHLKLVVASVDGTNRVIELVKPLEKALGLQFEDSLIANPKTCGNDCVFCFIAQMPKGLRPSLYVRDDDWRMSLLMGNYITLTNVGDHEFERIIRRKASPLYISVHATDDKLREQMVRNKKSRNLMSRLRRLKEEGLKYHCQLVVCPGLNDGDQLKNSLDDLIALFPAALSVAVVPVGLTKHRDGLTALRPFTKEEAEDILDLCRQYQEKCLNELGTRFVFPADEFLSLAKAPIPPDEVFEDYAQIENGVGMLRQFEDGLKDAWENDKTDDQKPETPLKTVLFPCGKAVYDYLKVWKDLYFPKNIHPVLVPVTNEFFGDTVTVTGLITGQDLVSQLSNIQADAVMICETMLNSDNTMFLDDLTPEDVAEKLNMPLYIFKNDGYTFYHQMKNLFAQTSESKESP